MCNLLHCIAYAAVLCRTLIQRLVAITYYIFNKEIAMEKNIFLIDFLLLKDRTNQTQKEIL